MHALLWQYLTQFLKHWVHSLSDYGVPICAGLIMLFVPSHHHTYHPICTYMPQSSLLEQAGDLADIYSDRFDTKQRGLSYCQLSARIAPACIGLWAVEECSWASVLVVKLYAAACDSTTRASLHIASQSPHLSSNSVHHQTQCHDSMRSLSHIIARVAGTSLVTQELDYCVYLLSGGVFLKQPLNLSPVPWGLQGLIDHSSYYLMSCMHGLSSAVHTSFW